MALAWKLCVNITKIASIEQPNTGGAAQPRAGLESTSGINPCAHLPITSFTQPKTLCQSSHLNTSNFHSPFPYLHCGQSRTLTLLEMQMVVTKTPPQLSAVASRWHIHKNTWHFTSLPQLAVLEACIRYGCHQGPQKADKLIQNLTSEKNKWLQNSLLSHQSYTWSKKMSARVMNAE